METSWINDLKMKCYVFLFIDISNWFELLILRSEKITPSIPTPLQWEKASSCLDQSNQGEQQGCFLVSTYLVEWRRGLASKSCSGHIAPTTIHWNSWHSWRMPIPSALLWLHSFCQYIGVTSPGRPGSSASLWLMTLCGEITEQVLYRRSTTTLCPGPEWCVSL